MTEFSGLSPQERDLCSRDFASRFDLEISQSAPGLHITVSTSGHAEDGGLGMVATVGRVFHHHLPRQGLQTSSSSSLLKARPHPALVAAFLLPTPFHSMSP